MPDRAQPEAPIAVLSIGNTSTTMGIWHQARVTGIVGVGTANSAEFDGAFDVLARSFAGGKPPAVVVASVVPAALMHVRQRVEAVIDRAALVVGEQVAHPIDVALKDAASVGMDRICCAAAVYDRLQHSAVVVDFGTAVTVDLVDDDGAFQGGAILPGLHLQLGALHEHTAQLPLAEPAFPTDPIGRDTVQAIQTGVCRGLAGAVRGLVEAFATQVNHWPQVVVTGGDAVFMAPHCDFVDNVVPDLCLRGVGLAYDRHIRSMGL